MARRSEFVAYVCELLAPLGALRAKAMFGGWGLYADELFFAIVLDDVLYLKADDESRERFVAAAQRPFTVTMRGIEQRMDYYTVPEAALDDGDELLPWARLALAAARRKAARGTRVANRPARRRP
ncbi:TfoX/Sxy family protein [Solimonas soli]|uniref:TfoX/Sxy family protein n=1 Tax=Solimonas soli TaxID=413479 RepID=UPI000483DBD5|nr:TfoX/Sxy family protein [Solimonas soli]